MPRHVKPLTEVRIRQAKAGDYPLWDGGGLHLILATSGARHWRLKYYRPDGRENRIALGTYPETSLSAARQRRTEARALLSAGGDPAVARTEKKETARREQRSTFAAAAEGWLAFKSKGWAKDTARKARWVVDTHLLPSLGKRSIATLSTKDVLPPLQKLAAKAPDVARKARQYVGGIVRYAQREGFRDESRALPLDEILPSYDKGHIPAATAPDEIAKVLRAVDAYSSPVTRAALLWCAYTAQRPGIVVSARWDEITGNEWHIPGERMKVRQRQPHIVPLPRQALALLEELTPYTAGREFVFPPLARQQSKHLHRDALSKALRDMGFSGTHATHGFRGMLRTTGRERLGIDSDVLEAQLAHAKRGAVQQAYDRTTFTEARAKAMQRWADYLDQLKTGANVTPIGRKRA